MRTGRIAAVRRMLGAAAAGVALAAGASRADDAAPPTAERVELDEKAGHVEEALQGWASRYLGVPVPADRAAALRRYVDLAAKNPALPDGSIEDAVDRSGPGLKIAAGRRAVVVLSADLLGGVDVKRIAALADAAELAVERICGVRPPVGTWTKEDPRPRDKAGRFVVGVALLPKPAADQAFDGRAWPSGATGVGGGLVYSLAGAFAEAAIPAAPNHRARFVGASVERAVRDLAVRDVGEPAAIAVAEEYRVRAKEGYEAGWAPGCLPGEWIPDDEPLSHLFLAALDAERAAKRDPFEAMHEYLTEPRRDAGWNRRFAATSRDLAFEPLAAGFGETAIEAFRAAGVVPAGAAFEEMKQRVAADELARDAEDLRRDDQWGPAARGFRNAAAALGASVAADALLLDALEIEQQGDPRKARAAVKNLGLIEGFDFVGPFPEAANRGDVSPSSRLMPLALAAAEARHPLKLKEPFEVSLKWNETKKLSNELVCRTPDGDWNGTPRTSGAVAVTKWAKDLGRIVRLGPCRGDWADVVVAADGRVLDRWPDGSFLVPGAKGTEIVLASQAHLTCSVPWRDAKSVDDDLAAAASEKDAVLALRPWAARRVATALPAIAAALAKLADDALVREIRLLAPYRGGDAATCDAMLACAQGRPAVLAAYLDVCCGSRDAGVVDRLVALAAADGAAPDTAARVRRVLEGVLFRKVTEQGPDLAALWERGKKWMASAAFAEGEDVRDLHDVTTCFRVVADAAAWGRACIASSGGWSSHGEGCVCLNVPEGPGDAWLTVRWQGAIGARLALRGFLSDGRKPKPFSVDMPAPVSEKPEWVFDTFDLGAIPRGRIVLAIDDPCASGCRIDAFAIGAAPLK